jgi:hypothetical protein
MKEYKMTEQIWVLRPADAPAAAAILARAFDQEPAKLALLRGKEE